MSTPNHTSLSARLVFALRRKPGKSDNSRTSRAKSESQAADRNNGSMQEAPTRKSISYKIPVEDFENYYDDMAGLGMNATISNARNRNVGSIGSIDGGSSRTRGSIDSGFSRATTLAEKKDSRTERVHADVMHNLADFEPSDVDEDDEENEAIIPRREKIESPHEVEQPFLTEELAFDPDLVTAREQMISSLPPAIWERILSFITLADAGNLALSSKSLKKIVGSKIWQSLNSPENRQHKALVLIHVDSLHPDHLLCFPCAKYHLRTQRGKERLDANFVLNTLFDCPSVRTSILPRIRVTHGRELPFSFVQLALRANRHSPEFGIESKTLARGWKCRDSNWSHNTQFYIHKGHLLFRCVSTSLVRASLTQSEERLFLYSRGDYTPYFSVCAHWKDGELMNLCKCAMSHVPKRRESITSQLKRAPKVSLAAARTSYIARLCEDCKPMRRCPLCPTEYLLTIKMVEDKKDPLDTFKHAITLTRWSDLGDGTSPYSPEWAACTGQGEFDSFAMIGRRTIAGTFESAMSNTPPGERVLSLNPKMILKGEDGHSWY